MAKSNILFFDTTLRDGEQTPGVSLRTDEKLEIAQALDGVGVDIIEAGFPVTSEGDFEAVKAVAESGLKSTVCGLARCVEKDLDACMKAEVDLIHAFIGTSPLHREHKLKMSKQEIIESAEKTIQYCLDQGFKVHFSPEDACRTERDYLTTFCREVEEAGASMINIPDTVGVMYPKDMYGLITHLKESIKVPIAVHCHNDYGLAVANTVESVKAGATIPHTTINGLGERAGNADMEQTVMVLENLLGIKTNIKKKKIYETCKLVERLSGVRMPPNFPIVGDNAFAHESGIHVHAVLKKASTYEPMKPEDVGARRKLVIGKHVGAHGVDAKLKEMKIKASEEQVREITSKIKTLADKNKKITEEDLLAIAHDVTGRIPKEERIFELKDLEIQDKLGKNPVAKVTLLIRGKTVNAKSDGVGPVDATLNAIKEAAKDFGKLTLEEFHLDAITGGSDALAEVTLKLSDEKHNSVLSRGVHENITMASVEAFINGLNRLFIS